MSNRQERKARKAAGEKLVRTPKKPTGKYVSKNEARQQRRDQEAAERVAWEMAQQLGKWKP